MFDILRIGVGSKRMYFYLIRNDVLNLVLTSHSTPWFQIKSESSSFASDISAYVYPNIYQVETELNSRNCNRGHKIIPELVGTKTHDLQVLQQWIKELPLRV